MPQQSDAEVRLRLKAALALQQQGRLADAESAYRAVLALAPDNAFAHQLLGTIAVQRNRLAEALALFERALRAKPDFADAHNNRGMVLQALKRPEEALAAFERAIAIEADYADAHNNRGVMLQEMGRGDDALESFARAVAANPRFAMAHFNRGNLLRRLNRFGDALQSYDQVIAIEPRNAEAHYNRGLALHKLGRVAEALQAYDRALGLAPDSARALTNRGVALTELGRLGEALTTLDRALQLSPQLAEAHNDRGNVLRQLRRLDEALESYRSAITLQPDFADAHHNQGLTLQDMKRPDEAFASFSRAMQVRPDHPFLRGTWLLAKMELCEWEDHAAHVAELGRRIERGEKAAPPFCAVVLADVPAWHRKAAETWVAEKHAASAELGAIPRRTEPQRIHIGYYSADFHEHATAYLMAQVFEEHDRERFQLSAFSFGPPARGSMRERLRAAFDSFVEVGGSSDRDIALASRQRGVDIAIDLKGFTRDARAGLFSYRAAPVQAGYLGFPGTTGAPYMDYLVADRMLIPPESRQHYSEKIAYLPGSYQANDRRREIADRRFTRAELGLPPQGFVFCCFNNNFKITPEVFDGWMRILQRVPGSVLWLLEDNPTAARNLRREAGKRGVAGARLVFSGRMALAEHLARHRVADLFLDTLPCNAHTTASDALWAGLPVLTRAGSSFAGRVAASLLGALGLHQLITASQEQYEARAMELATQPPLLEALKAQLAERRLSASLFDPVRFVRHLERAYVEMHRKARAGLPPEDILIED